MTGSESVLYWHRVKVTQCLHQILTHSRLAHDSLTVASDNSDDKCEGSLTASTGPLFWA